MHRQLAMDFLVLSLADQEKVRKALNIVVVKGRKESKADYALRLLTEVDNAGKLRLLEELIVGGI